MGQLICLEGIDGCGKDTQAQLLAAKVVARRHSAAVLTFPDYASDLGSLIARWLQDPNHDPAGLQMLFSAERVARRREIVQAVRRHDFVFTSRYAPSGIIYGSQRGLPIEWLARLEIVLPAPTRIILLDISAEVSMERSGRKDSLDSDSSLLAGCRGAYLTLARADTELWSIVDAACERDTLTERLLAITLAGQP